MTFIKENDMQSIYLCKYISIKKMIWDDTMGIATVALVLEETSY